MKKKYLTKLRLSIVGLCSLFSQLGLAGPIQTYRIGWYPTDDNVCQQDAEIIAQQFELVTGLPVLVAGCERPLAWKLDMVIQYQSDAPVAPVSTFDDFSDQQGTYATKTECENNLASEKIIFKEKTGLSPIVAFCFAQGRPSRENPHAFALRIDGFGAPNLRPYVKVRTFYEKLNTPSSDVVRVVSEALSTNQYINNLRVLVDYTDGRNRIVIKYYATRRQSLLFESFASFENATVCKENSALIANLFEEFGVPGAKTFCTNEEFLESSPLYLAGSVLGAYSLERVPRTFSTRQQCQAALPEIISRYAASSGSNLVKGFCSYESPEVLSNYGFFAKVLMQK